MVEGGDTTIRVSVGARERLNQLAAEHGTTTRALVEELANGRLTRAELEQRHARTVAYVRRHLSEGERFWQTLEKEDAQRAQGNPASAA
jgi:hypothetical protein